MKRRMFFPAALLVAALLPLGVAWTQDAETSRRLYANDPVYRAQMDALAAEAAVDRKRSDAAAERMNALLRRHGITTSVDAELAEQLRNRDLAEQRGDLMTLLQLDTIVSRLRERQSEEARRKAQGSP